MAISPAGTEETTISWGTLIGNVDIGGETQDVAAVGGAVYLTSGVAFIDFDTVAENPEDWTKEEVVFLVGPKITGQYAGSVVIAVPATIDIVRNLDTSQTVGWGVDVSYTEFDTDSQRVKVHANLVLKTKYSEILRIAYQVTTVVNPK